MAQIIDEKPAVAVLDKYFDALSEMGYVKTSTTSRMLLYMFLIDFVDSVFPFLTEKDYMKIRNLLARIYSGGDCLLPYPLHCAHKITLGKSYPMGSNYRRINNDGEDILRKTDYKKLRRI